jgi:two-component system response regulator YesN
MLKVLIVDDEILVRIGLKAALDWEANGFVVAGEAGNGKAALDIIRAGGIDIVLLDVKMPIMNGLEVMKAIIDENITTRVIILSCYDEFEYVKEAMRLGAVDYILKLTLKTDKLLQILCQIKNDLGISPLENSCGGMHKDWLRLIKEYDDDTWNKIKQYDCRLSDGKLTVFCILRENITETSDGASPRYVRNMISDIINNYANGECIETEENKFIAVLNPKFYETQHILNIANNIMESIKKYTCFVVSIGFSTIHKGIQEFPKGVAEAENALTARYLRGKGCICDYSDMFYHGAPTKKVIFSNEQDLKLKRALQYGNLLSSKSVVDDFRDTLTNLKYAEKTEIVAGAYDFILVASNVLREYGIRLEELELFESKSPKEMLEGFEFANELMDFLYKLIEVCVAQLEASKGKGVQHREIIKAMQYIDDNYTEDIGLSNLAAYVGLSESYLSYLFKKETGKGIANYISHLRLEEGKRLLQTSDLSVNEIVQKIGFSNIYYFSNTFKKAYGFSPTEYRKRFWGK